MAETTYSEQEMTTKTGGYWSTDDEVIEDVARRRKLADRAQSDWRECAGRDFEFVAGTQWLDDDKQHMEQVQKKPAVTFNRVGPIINAVCGQQICNRQEPAYLGRNEMNMQKAEVWTKVARWSRELSDAEDTESDSFRDMVITGMGWTCTEMVYDEDPAGLIARNRLDPRRFRWDPSSRKKNLADMRWVQCDWWYSKEEIEEKWPGAEISIDPKAMVAEDDSPEQPHDATNAWRYDKNSIGKDWMRGMYRCVHEIHYRLEDAYQIGEPSGGISVLSPEDYAKLEKRVEMLGFPMPQVAKTQHRVYYEAWTCAGTVLHKGKYALEKGFEYECMTGLRDEKGQWYGLVEALRDPQMFANKVFTQLIQILNSNAKGGIIAEKTAVTNQRNFETQWSKSDGVAWVEDGAVSGGKIQPKAPPQIPAEITKLLEYSIGGLREVTGVNVEFLGQTDKVQPGVVEAMRTKAGLIILAPWFDAMRLYLKRHGRLLSEFLYKYIADNRWVRITGDVGPQFIQLAKDPSVLEYDVVVEEVTQSRDARDRTFQALLQFMPMVIQSGVPVPPDLVDYLPIPEALRMKWKQLIMQKMSQPQQPPLALMIEQMRGENQKQVEQIRGQQKAAQSQMDASIKQQQIYMEAQTERVIQAAQAESQRMVDFSKMQQDSVTTTLEMRAEQQKMLLQARLDTFETVLNALVDMQKQREQAHTDIVNAENKRQQNETNVLPAVLDMMRSHQSTMESVMKWMSAPVEIERDPVTGKKRGRRVLNS